MSGPTRSRSSDRRSRPSDDRERDGRRRHRLLRVAVPASAATAYLIAATVLVGLVSLLAGRPPSLPAAIAGVILGALVVGYASYRLTVVGVPRRVGAVELDPGRAPGVYRRLERLAAAMELPVPTLYVARLATPNAFTVGGPDGAVVVDERLFGLLSAAEFEAILAHELAHLESRDALVQTVAYGAGQSLVIALAALVLPVALVAGALAELWTVLTGRPAAAARSLPGRVHGSTLRLLGGVGFASTLFLLAYSRDREYAADDRAAAVVGPLTLARALWRLHRAAEPDRGLLTPLLVHGDDDHPLSRLLSTHPPVGDRLDRLVERARTERARDRRGDGDSTPRR